MLHLHVVLAVDRAGLVGEDGETHHGIYDVGFLRHAPGLTVLAPGSCAELKDMLTWAVEGQNGPVAIRYPRGGDRSYSESAWETLKDIGVISHRKGEQITLLTYGVLLDNALKAAELLSAQGMEVNVLRLLCLSPLPVDGIAQQLPANGTVVVLEEVSKNCGISQELALALQTARPDCRVLGMDLGGQYVRHGAIGDLYKHYGLSPEAIAEFVAEEHKGEN